MFSSIQQYLNVIRLLHLESGYDNPLADNWMLKSVLQGIKRVKGNSVAHKEPITPDLLLAFHRRLKLSDPRQSAFWAACLILFFGLFRKSNVLAPSIAEFVRSIHLSREDFNFYDWGIAVTVYDGQKLFNAKKEFSMCLSLLFRDTRCAL